MSLKTQISANGHHGILGSDCVLRVKAGLHVDRSWNKPRDGERIKGS